MSHNGVFIVMPAYQIPLTAIQNAIIRILYLVKDSSNSESQWHGMAKYNQFLGVAFVRYVSEYTT